MKRVYMVLLALCLLLAGCGGQKTDEVDLKPVCIDGKWGYTNAKGELVIDAKYNMAHAFYEGLALVTDDPNKLFWKYIDTNGDQAIDDQYGKAGNFSMGLAMVMIAGKCGYINKKGEIVIEPQYQFARAFAENGLAPVKVEDLWGYIDREGTMVIQPQFLDAESFDSTGVAMVVTTDCQKATLQENGEYTVAPDSGIVIVD
jgi:hypothetical protein